MSEITWSTGFPGDKLLINVEWRDHNNVQHIVPVVLRMASQDKPRTFEVEVGAVVAGFAAKNDGSGVDLSVDVCRFTGRLNCGRLGHAPSRKTAQVIRSDDKTEILLLRDGVQTVSYTALYRVPADTCIQIAADAGHADGVEFVTQ